MLPKKTLLISAVMTAFVLSMLGGVAVALKQPATPATVVAAAAALPTVTAALTPQEAAALAASVLNQQDVYSVESAPYNGADAYKVVFSSGQVAFVGLDGQILSITQIQPVVVAQNNFVPAQTSSGSDQQQAPAASQSGGGGHEDSGHDNGEQEGGGHDD